MFGGLEMAGLWDIWTDKETGEVVASSMLTINADAQPLMNRMHRPCAKRPANMQDKRSGSSIALVEVDAWRTAHVQQAATLMEVGAGRGL
jgi:hypothetical protein